MREEYIREKKRFCWSIDSMEADENAQVKLVSMAEELGRDIRVFRNSASIMPSDITSSVSVSNSDEEDDFYEFTAEDYFRILSSRKEDKVLKTRKIREEEEAARRSKFTKAVIRIRFPDGYIVEAKFHPTETVASLMEFVKKIIAQPDVPFYICEYLFTFEAHTVCSMQDGSFDITPPKQQLKDMAKDFFSVGFVPGAIVYFSYDLPKDEEGRDASSTPFLRNDIMALAGLGTVTQQAETVQPLAEPAAEDIPVEGVSGARPVVKKPVKPKWFKM
ncbi:Plant UBX domain-containing protein 1 [Nymphaea thermarum]|nr:Plant UBX domain-containing protein 1 [Nymphaea thermarum]